MLHDGQLQATFNTAAETWRIVTLQNSISSDLWQYVQLSWHPEKGAYVHIDKQRVRHIVRFHRNVSDADQPLQNQTSTVYLGSFDQRVTQTQYFQVFIDELSIWFADRDYVKAFGFLEDGK